MPETGYPTDLNETINILINQTQRYHAIALSDYYVSDYSKRVSDEDKKLQLARYETARHMLQIIGIKY